MENLPFKLSPRLELCAKYVRDGVKIADIGTDHAYLPIHLAISGKIISGIAADIKEAPLERGKENIIKYGVCDKVSVILSDGLQKIESDMADDIIIAGMGGELIAKIISEAPWLNNSDKHLILQPMSRPEALREYLYKNGFEIITEECVLSEGRVYSVMLVTYNGKNLAYSNKDKYMGKIKKQDNEELFKHYKAKVISRLTKKAEGCKISGDLAEYNTINNILDDLGGLT